MRIVQNLENKNFDKIKSLDIENLDKGNQKNEKFDYKHLGNDNHVCLWHAFFDSGNL